MIPHTWSSIPLFLSLIKAQLCHLQIRCDNYTQQITFFKDILDTESNALAMKRLCLLQYFSLILLLRVYTINQPHVPELSCIYSSPHSFTYLYKFLL